MKKSEAKKLLKQEILSVLNEEFQLHETDAQLYDEIADTLRDLAEKALSAGNKELAKQLTNIATFSDREQNKQVSGDDTSSIPDLDMGGEDIEIEDTEIEDLDVEEEPEDTKKKKVKEYLRTEILKTLR
jgi:DNA-binding ferritin-like protein